MHLNDISLRNFDPGLELKYVGHLQTMGNML